MNSLRAREGKGRGGRKRSRRIARSQASGAGARGAARGRPGGSNSSGWETKDVSNFLLRRALSRPDPHLRLDPTPAPRSHTCTSTAHLHLIWPQAPEAALPARVAPALASLVGGAPAGADEVPRGQPGGPRMAALHRGAAPAVAVVVVDARGAEERGLGLLALSAALAADDHLRRARRAGEGVSYVSTWEGPEVKRMGS
jgi:hypothetical protein